MATPKKILLANGIDLLNPPKETMPTPPTKPFNPNKVNFNAKLCLEDFEIKEDPNQKKIVIPNLAPSLSAMMARHKAGIPNTVATRSLESYYRNTDLTDIEQINAHYLELSEKIETQAKRRDELKKQAKEAYKQQQQKIIEFMSQQNQASPK